MKLLLTNYGENLRATNKGFKVVNKEGSARIYPFHIIDQILLTTGNTITTDALFWASIYKTNITIMTKTGRNISQLNSLPYGMNAEMRKQQYAISETEKGMNIAIEIIKAKIQSQINLLTKYNLPTPKTNATDLLFSDDNLRRTRKQLLLTEARFARHYFGQILTTLPKQFSTNNRKTHKATEPFNNLLNLGYELLQAEIYRALTIHNLDPYVGFLHTESNHSRPSLACDIQELFRPLVDDYCLKFIQEANPNDFHLINERQFLKNPTKFLQGLNYALNQRLINTIPPEDRNRGNPIRKRQLIDSECAKLAKHIRGESTEYKPIILPIDKELF